MLDRCNFVTSDHYTFFGTGLCVRSIERNNGCRTARGPRGDTDDEEESAKVVGITTVSPSHFHHNFFGANSRSINLKMVRDMGKRKVLNIRTKRHLCLRQKPERLIFWKNCLESDME